MTFSKIIASAAAVYVPDVVKHEEDFRNVKNFSIKHSFALQNHISQSFKDEISFKDPISNFTVNAVRSFSGYKLGEYFAGDDASLTKTVIASAIGGAVIQTTLNAFIFEIAFENMSFKSFLSFFFKNIIEIPVSSGLLAYINYEDSDKASELNIDNIGQQDI